MVVTTRVLAVKHYRYRVERAAIVSSFAPRRTDGTNDAVRRFVAARLGVAARQVEIVECSRSANRRR
jgi:hypothetical protein